MGIGYITLRRAVKPYEVSSHRDLTVLRLNGVDAQGLCDQFQTMEEFCFHLGCVTLQRAVKPYEVSSRRDLIVLQFNGVGQLDFVVPLYEEAYSKLFVNPNIQAFWQIHNLRMTRFCLLAFSICRRFFHASQAGE